MRKAENKTDIIPDALLELKEEMLLARQMRVEAIGKEVAKKRDEAVKGRKQSGIEAIWDEDEEYYEGIDDANRSTHPMVKSASTTGGISRDQVKTSSRCTSFFNITRQFVESAAARMGDILLPAGDWNFGMKATPVQDTQSFKIAAQLPPKPQTPAEQSGEFSNTQLGDGLANKLQEEADKKAENAELWVQDKLIECSYHTEVRKVIEDAAKIGTGVLKGPFQAKVKNCKTVTKDGAVGIEVVESINPTSKRVDPRDCFPDPACGDNIHNGSYFLERDRLSAKQLLSLIGTQGYLEEQILQVIDEGPYKKNYDDGRRVGNENTDKDAKFEVWYFYGLVDVADLAALQVTLTESDRAKQMLPAVVTLVNDTAIKAFINPMDTGDFPYDVMVWQTRAESWAGIGISRQGRTAQDMLNAAARAMMDNAGLSSGPMIIMRRKAIEPADGKWELSNRKIWWATAEVDMKSVADAILAINIPMMQAELSAIIQLAYKMMEDATGIFFIMQGQQGSAPDTVGGMELMHRNASAILRRIARVFDERITEPHMRRYYQWILMYGPEDCKGDLKIQAIGSTALVEREIQAMEAMVLLQMSLNPAYGLDPEKAMVEVLKTKRFIPDKWTLSEEKKKALKPAVIPAIEIAKIKSADLDKQLAQEKDIAIATQTMKKYQTDVDTDRDRVYNDHMATRDQTQASVRIQELQMKRELALLDYSNKRGITLDQIKSQLAQTAMKLRTQKQLAGVAQVMAPPTEPPQHAADGKAFEQ